MLDIGQTQPEADLTPALRLHQTLSLRHTVMHFGRGRRRARGHGAKAKRDQSYAPFAGLRFQGLAVRVIAR